MWTLLSQQRKPGLGPIQPGLQNPITAHNLPKKLWVEDGLHLTGGRTFSTRSAGQSHSSRSLTITLALLPAVVCVVIMMVNGNVGTGVAVAGAFSLVRFRSAPGTAREISAIFVAMGTGLITGMGYLLRACSP